MKHTLLFLFLFTCSQISFSQDSTNSKLPDSIICALPIPEQAEFPGGSDSLFIYFKQNLKWPKSELDKCVTGKVYVEFTVASDGSIKDVKVIKGLSPAFDKEAIRVVESMPKWIPGKQNGKPVETKFKLPITFKR